MSGPPRAVPVPPPGMVLGQHRSSSPPMGFGGVVALVMGCMGREFGAYYGAETQGGGRKGLGDLGGCTMPLFPPPQPKSAAAAAVPAPDGGTLGRWKFCNYTKTVPRKWRQFAARLKSCILLLKLFQLICIFQPKCTGDGKISKLSLTSR